VERAEIVHINPSARTTLWNSRTGSCVAFARFGSCLLSP